MSLELPLSRPGLPTSQNWLLYCRRICTHRVTITAISLSCLLLLVGLARHAPARVSLWCAAPSFIQPEGQPLPPLYSEYREFERALPQHDDKLPFPEGREGRYLWIANHVHGSGWGNVLQEQIMHAYLTEKTGRGFVYNNYTWNSDGSDYSEYNGKLIPSRIPTTALIQGPIVGTRLGPDAKLPRAIMKEYWDHICPKPHLVKSDDILDGMGVHWKGASTIIDAYVQYLGEIEDRCIEIMATSWTIFDLWIMGDAGRLLDVWSDLKTSTVVTEFAWSSLVELAFEINRQIVSPLTTYEEVASSSRLVWERYPEIPGLLVIHLRRGDFEQHCLQLRGYHSAWLAFNGFPELPDKYSPPSDWDSEEYKEYYEQHCFPTIDQILARVDAIRLESAVAGKDLHNLYIMTNGPSSWVDDLKVALWETGHWTHVSSSRDLHLTPEQKYIAQAIDMLIGQRAAVFLGNGWSSLSGIVTMLRMASQINPQYTRIL